jgi:hypothetical protein
MNLCEPVWCDSGALFFWSHLEALWEPINRSINQSVNQIKSRAIAALPVAQTTTPTLPFFFSRPTPEHGRPTYDRTALILKNNVRYII